MEPWPICCAIPGMVTRQSATAVAMTVAGETRARVPRGISLLEPLQTTNTLSVGIAAVIVDERPSATQLLGVALVVVGVVIAASSPRTRKLELEAAAA